MLDWLQALGEAVNKAAAQPKPAPSSSSSRSRGGTWQAGPGPRTDVNSPSQQFLKRQTVGKPGRAQQFLDRQTVGEKGRTDEFLEKQTVGDSDKADEFLEKQGVSFNYLQDLRDTADKLNERREERDEALPPSTFLALGGSSNFNELTTEQYNKLSDRQRAAVDYNTMLYQAVQNDLKNQEKYSGLSKEDKAAYNVASEEMFGKANGSDTYAPETMAVLQQLNLKDKAADLDDYLGLRTVITDDDLELIDRDLGESEFSKVSDAIPDLLLNVDEPLKKGFRGAAAGEVLGEDATRFMIFDDAIAKTQGLQQTMAKSNAILESFNSSAAAERRGRLEKYGVDVGEPAEAAPGFGTGEQDEYFRMAFDALSDSELPSDQAVTMLSQTFENPSVLDDFYKYVDLRTQNARRYNQAMGDTEGIKYRTPDELRKLLGLEK